MFLFKLWNSTASKERSSGTLIFQGKNLLVKPKLGWEGSQQWLWFTLHFNTPEATSQRVCTDGTFNRIFPFVSITRLMEQTGFCSNRSSCLQSSRKSRAFHLCSMHWNATRSILRPSDCVFESVTYSHCCARTHPVHSTDGALKLAPLTCCSHYASCVDTVSALWVDKLKKRYGAPR